MNSERIKEIQEQTAYPESVSVYKALMQVWNECLQEHNEQLRRIANVVNCENECIEDIAINYLRDKILPLERRNKVCKEHLARMMLRKYPPSKPEQLRRKKEMKENSDKIEMFKYLDSLVREKKFS